MITVFCCNPEEALVAQLIAETEREERERERELDLERERELHPPIAVQRPEVICASIVLDWDAYAR